MNRETMLDQDVCYKCLGASDEERQSRYRGFVGNDMSVVERKLIKNAVGRIHLTGNNRFIDEIEMRIGMWIEQRDRGRPGNENK